ncbi:complement factor B-like [Triplophysa dalaica]|uniref:complement factor B-like n=1 Tax=Triplophysa dalaica TaxID=1582913 RepID=UPI0024DF74EC|nr:complement factor B-like [Triplophysa dalaica]
MESKQRLSWFMLAVICPLITGAPSLMPQEEVKTCPTEGLSITGGSFVISNSHGIIVKYSCPEDFYPNFLTRKCLDGSWEPNTKKPAVCKKVTCPNPRVYENGEVIPYKDRYYVNDTTNYTCNSDYVFRGSQYRFCKPNGKWSGSTPICGRNSEDCPDPGVPPGSHRTGTMFKIDDKVTYRCENKLALIGSKQRVCQEDGQWSGTEPQCYAEFTYDTPEEASQAFGSSLKTNLEFHKQEDDQEGKLVRLNQNGTLDIYIYLDASDSIEEKDFETAKAVIKALIETISYYQVSPNYEIRMFATEVKEIVTMRNFKTIPAEKNLEEISKRLDAFSYESKGDRSGTNICQAFKTILDSMGIEKINDKNFAQTQHVIIMFTDGHANMGGNPKPKVDQIKHFIADESKLDIYIFGVGNETNLDIDDLVTKRDGEKHFFKLPNLNEVQKTFDQMIDEDSSNQLCGIQQNVPDNKRRAFPWLAQIKITRLPTGSNCMGSLVTPTYILTAAHCFRFGDTREKITITLKKNNAENLKVKRFILHREYNVEAKKNIGIPEYYEYDVALIELENAVSLDREIRTICIPCTKETNGALKLSDSEGTCQKHEELIMGPDLVSANFTSEMKDGSPKYIRSITIKQRGLRDDCVEDAKKADIFKKSNATLNAKDIVTDNFLCSGGISPITDHIACKGDSGGATYLHKNDRMIQIGVVSWGSKNKCNDEKDNTLSDKESRDYHTNLFSPKIREFLQKHLGEEKQKGTPLHFLSK